MLKVIIDYFTGQWYTIANAPSFVLVTLSIGFALGWFSNSTLQKNRLEATEERLKAIEERYKLKDEQVKHLENQLVSFTEEVSKTGEELIKETSLNYYLQDAALEPSEVALLKTRGFQKVAFHSKAQSLRNSSGNIVVLDLKNWIGKSNQNFSALPDVERQEVAEKLIDSVLDILPSTTVLVVYTRSLIRHLLTISEERHILAANNQGTLLGAVVNAAYVSANEIMSNVTQANNPAGAD